MRETLKSLMRLPARTLHEKRIAKKLICEQNACNRSDAKLIEDALEAVWIVAIVNEDTANIPPHADETHNYSESYVILAELRQRGKALRIGELLDALIPNPTLLAFSHEGELQFQVADKRLNLNDASRTVTEARWSTPWLKPSSSILSAFDVGQWSHADLLAFMTDGKRAVLSSALSDLCRQEVTAKGLSINDSEAAYLRLKELAAEMAGFEAEKKKTLHFGDRTALHVKFKTSEREYNEIVSAICHSREGGNPR